MSGVVFAGEEGGAWSDSWGAWIRESIADAWEIANPPEGSTQLLVASGRPQSLQDAARRFRANQIRLLFCDEAFYPDINLWDFAVGYPSLELGARYLQWHPLHFFTSWKKYFSVDALQGSKQVDAEWWERDFCDFIYSNSNANKIREQFFNQLSALRHVSSLGSYRNNTPSPTSCEDLSDWREQLICLHRQHKFAIAMENTEMSGYTSEKLIAAVVAGCIPIYWGNADVGHIFNRDRFINAHEFESLEAVSSYVLAIESDPAQCNEILAQPIMTPSQVLIAEEWGDRFQAFLRGVLQAVCDNVLQRPVGTFPSTLEENWVAGMRTPTGLSRLRRVINRRIFGSIGAK